MHRAIESLNSAVESNCLVRFDKGGKFWLDYREKMQMLSVKWVM